MKAPTLTYLPHLDGLRALAFVYVLLFHFRVLGADGGYLGVDIFLVLSGFLMTRIILRDVAGGTFGMGRFMARRFWRLYPTLLVTVLCTLLGSLLVYSPKLVAAVGKSSLAALLFSSNVYFQQTVGYFDLATELKPLLHTWSLSLEEQFYFFWPLFLFAAYRSAARTPGGLSSALAFATAASLAAALWAARASTSFAFFSLPTRVFEFAAGGLLSLHFDGAARALERVRLHHAAAVLGAVLVNYPVFWPPASHLPGPASMPTLFGSALLIATPNSFLSRFVLANPGVRFVGALSYAGYLVHWPVWAFALFVFDKHGVGAVNKPAMFISTFVLAYALHKGVENRFRHKRSLAQSASIIALLTGTLLLAFGAVATRGYYEARVSKVGPPLHYFTPKYNRRDCLKLPRNHALFAPLNGAKPPEHCYIGPGVVAGKIPKRLRPDVVVVGSSFAGHLVPSMRLLSLQRNESYLVLHRQSCPLIFDSKLKFSYPMLPGCLSGNRKRIKILRSLPPTPVLLAEFWRTRFSWPDGMNAYFRSTCPALGKLGHPITVIGAPPSMGQRPYQFVRSCYMLRDMRLGKLLRFALGLGEGCPTLLNVPHQAKLNNYLKKFLAEDKKSQACRVFVDQFPQFCWKPKTGKCKFTIPQSEMTAPPGVPRENRPGNLLHWDGAHLSSIGSWLASREIGKLMREDKRFSMRSSHPAKRAKPGKVLKPGQPMQPVKPTKP